MIMIKNAGRSARQKTSKKTNALLLYAFMLAVAGVFFSACRENTSGQKMKAETEKPDSVKKPQEFIKVNRHYDDKGNMVGFDSTYTSFYSNMEGDTVAMDSMMKGFDRYLNQRYPSLLQREFEPLFFADSLRYPDFFHRDFFMKRYELNDAYMRDMMGRMDSIKNRYFEERKPPKKSETL
jgi:hypothetical protein